MPTSGEAPTPPSRAAGVRRAAGAVPPARTGAPPRPAAGVGSRSITPVPRSELAPVTPSVLKWARESIGVSIEEAARRAAVSPDRLAGWEAGDGEPTIAKLRSLASLYQRSLGVFFLPRPPAGFAVARDFRRLPGEEDHSWSRALHKVYRRALDQQLIAIELLDDEGEEVRPTVPALSLNVGPEDAGGLAREGLGVTLAEQFKWRTPEDALAGWIEAVEDLGVLVLRTSEVRSREMRGFSIADARIPLVVVNALDFPRGQVFTLAHEFAHLMLREGGVCDLLEPDEKNARRVEVWCNAVAGALLLPRSSILDHSVLGNERPEEWEAEVLEFLSRRYGVSQEAVLRRLVTLGLAEPEYYEAMRAEYLAAYENARETERRRRREKAGGPPPHRMVIRDRGKPFVRLVLDAYQREAISPSTASTFLGLKVRHLPALDRESRPR